MDASPCRDREPETPRAKALVEAANHQTDHVHSHMIISPAELGSWTATAVRELFWNGIVVLPWVWTVADAAEFRAHLQRQPCYTAHVVKHSTGKAMTWGEAREHEMICHPMRATVTAPGFMEYVLPLTAVAEKVFGEPARLFSCNSFWTRPGKDADNPHVQEWHRDRDDRKFLALFMYGTDVRTKDDGWHEFALRTNKNNDNQNRTPYPTETIRNITGPAGTFFLADSSGLHIGRKPKHGERLLSWARWCVSERPYSYVFDELAPIPGSFVPCEKPNEALQQATSLVVDWTR